MDLRSNAAFPQTRWSLVSGARTEGAGRERALEELCGLYWQPVYAFLRRRGLPAADAQDAVQGFFLSLLREEGFGRADPECGRMRTFLLGALQRWQRGEWRKAVAAKRGGGLEILSHTRMEEESGFEAADEASPSPEHEFDRRCAYATLEAALRRLAEEQGAAGKGRFFSVMRPLLSPAGTHVTHEAAAAELSMTPEAFRVALHRLRKRFGELLRETVADTLVRPDPPTIDEEMAALREALLD